MWGGWPELKSLPVLPDGDQDGMPDDWEVKNKLNANDPSDASTYTVSKTYTNVEVYINGLTPLRVAPIYRVAQLLYRFAFKTRNAHFPRNRLLIKLLPV